MAAIYDRKILVPYLHSICTYHLAIREIEKRISQTREKIRECELGWEAEPRQWPKYEEERFPKIRLVLTICCAIIVVFGICLMCINNDNPDYVSMGTSTAISYGLIGAILLKFTITGIRDYQEAQETNRLIAEEYEEYSKEYSKMLQKVARMNREAKMQIPELQKKVVFYEEEKGKIEDLLMHAYSANIIPRNYRGLYQAVFLYDWFSTSGADNVESALSMFVLEEIKSKLDTIIYNQATQIMNQRIMIAQNNQSLEMQKEQKEEFQQYAARVAESMEQQTQYLEMIESNTAADAYFSMAEYLDDKLSK